MSEEDTSAEAPDETVSKMNCPGCEIILDVADFSPFDTIICPSCGHEMMIPATLDQYLLTKLLGEGSMGSVYLGVDQNLQRQVAVKVLRKKFGSDPQMWTHLEREAKAAASMNHPHVVHIFRLGRINGRPYIVMELVEEDHLEGLMEREGTLDEATAIRIAIEVISGLEAANDAGLVHGDIKPANILLGKKGKVKVGDFGLARFAGLEDEVEVWGTPYYIAPEKAKKEQEDFRSDLYSLGATLFHALTGQPPFNGEESTAVIDSALTAPTPEASDLRPDLSPGLNAIIYRMMAKNPDDRHESYAAAIADLKDPEKVSFPVFAEPTAEKKAGGSWWKRLLRRDEDQA